MHFADRQTNGQTDGRTNRWTASMRKGASRCRERHFNKVSCHIVYDNCALEL